MDLCNQKKNAEHFSTALLLRKLIRSQSHWKWQRRISKTSETTRDAIDENPGMVNKDAIMRTNEQSRYDRCGGDYAA